MFDLSPLLDAPAPVQAHVISALAALAATPVVIFRRRRDRLHKTLGYVWASAMALTAASSFLIMEIRLIGPFSPIHILSAVTLVNLVLAISAIRRKNRRMHETILRQTAFWALGVAGGFTLLPGRRMHEVLFGAAEDGTSIAAAASLAVLAAVLLWTGWKLFSTRPTLPAE
ncbi:DUF2306 domain-containing protein [uncultured Maritimibacter sp.]|jgi:uncharacterized membrane protein|uniref:DUF2306 domain-containing protein n=1 Tax=uncultured Maritimibacter sp. TaxID=991866 RepID=UPI0026236B2E|nr:DUF2306 domain-containing protein [uncultured Maritimibacter sp.]